MKKVANSLLMGMFGAAALLAGCGGGGGGSGTGGKGMTGSGGTMGGGVAIIPNDTGWVEGVDNTLGIQGAWYPYGDGTDGKSAMGNGTCQAKGMHPDSACSVITTPVPGSMTFAPSDAASGKMCTSGTVAQVIDIVGMTGMKDYSNIWGAGIGLDLAANKDGTKGTLDADAKGIKGISFDIDMVPTAKLRVEIAATATDNSTAGNNYWGATASYPGSPVVSGTNVIHWAEFTSPTATKVPNDLAHLESLQFHVPTVTTGSAPYSFCIFNLKMLTE
jgi:hypothetical protein